MELEAFRYDEGLQFVGELHVTTISPNDLSLVLPVPTSSKGQCESLCWVTQCFISLLDFAGLQEELHYAHVG